jgi:SH3 domain-containing YSC84-like protein 1
MKTSADGQKGCYGSMRVIAIGLCAIGFAFCFEPVLPLLLAQSNPPSGGPGGGPTLTLERSTDVLSDLGLNISSTVLNRAICVVVVPAKKKAAFIIGSGYGRGVLSCRSGRSFDGAWSNPVMLSLEGGTSDLQMGGQTSDLVLFIMNKEAASSVLSQKVKLGSDMSVSAGQDRYETKTDKTASVLSYSSEHGLFVGVSLSGSTIRPDNYGNRELYRRDIDAAELVRNSKTVIPIPEAARFLRLLNRISPKNEKSERDLP